MDLQIYNAILIERGINPYAYDTKKIRQYPNGERAFRHDIFKNKTIWTGDKKKDFKYFISSFHPLLGIFTVCNHHPYTKRKRLFTLSMMLCVGSFWASLSALFSVWARSRSNPMTYTQAYIFKCIVASCNGMMLWFMEICLRHLTQCVCRENVENKYSNYCCKLMTKCGLFLWYLVAMICVFLCMLYLIDYNATKDFAMIFILQFIISWCLQIIGLYVKFRVFWKKDNNAMQKLTRSRNNANIELTNGKETFFERVKTLMKNRKKIGYPYYISYEESNEWIARNQWYVENNVKNGMEIPLLGHMKRSVDCDKSEEILSLLSNDLELSDDEDV